MAGLVLMGLIGGVQAQAQGDSTGASTAAIQGQRSTVDIGSNLDFSSQIQSLINKNNILINQQLATLQKQIDSAKTTTVTTMPYVCATYGAYIPRSTREGSGYFPQTGYAPSATPCPPAPYEYTF